MFEQQLQNLGLTEGEAKVYEALLSLGSSTVGPIVKKSGVAYSNVYEILKRLIDKGLASYIVREKTKYFQSVEPTRLQEYLDKKEIKIQENKRLLSELLPKIQKLQKFVGKREEAEIFIGTKGLMTAYENLLSDSKKGDKLFFFYVHDPVYYELAEKFYMKSWKIFKKVNIDIAGYGVGNRAYKKTKLVTHYPKWIKQRYVDFPLPANIDIYRDKILIISWSEKPLGILIQSQEIAEKFKKYFDGVWKIAKP